MIFALLVTLAKPEEISLDESEPVPGSSRMAGLRKATTCSELPLVAGFCRMDRIYVTRQSAYRRDY
jgi:hypothetical protein